jgi:hypothetical protein
MREVERVAPRTPKPTERDTSRAFTREERDHVIQFAFDLAAAEGSIRARSGSGMQ